MKPLYQSIRASFSKDIYMPVCPVVAAPTVVLEVKKADDLSVLTRGIYLKDHPFETICLVVVAHFVALWLIVVISPLLGVARQRTMQQRNEQ